MNQFATPSQNWISHGPATALETSVTGGNGDDDWGPTAPEPAGDLGADDVANAVDHCNGIEKGKVSN
jgi:hypothetical protein